MSTNEFRFSASVRNTDGVEVAFVWVSEPAGPDPDHIWISVGSWVTQMTTAAATECARGIISHNAQKPGTAVFIRLNSWFRSFPNREAMEFAEALIDAATVALNPSKVAA